VAWHVEVLRGAVRDVGRQSRVLGGGSSDQFYTNQCLPSQFQLRLQRMPCNAPLTRRTPKRILHRYDTRRQSLFVLTGR